MTLVGSDTGGGICQLVVDAHPERIGRLVLTNCDAFDQCPPFPFGAVFGLLRGPVSIKALFGPMRLAALRDSPLGFGLLVTRPDNAGDGRLDRALPERHIASAATWPRCCGRSRSPISPTWRPG